MKQITALIAGHEVISLECDNEHIIHMVGQDDYPEIRRIKINPEHINLYEEIAIVDIPPYTKAQYKAAIIKLIRQRYDQDDENGILRQRDTKPDEFAAYNAYAEQCKIKAKELLILESINKNTE